MASETLEIDLKAGTKQIVKVGFAVQGILILAAIVVLLFFGLSIIKDITILSFILIGAGIFFFFIARTYLKNAFLKEWISVDAENITIGCKTLLSDERHTLAINDIKYFSHAGTREYTEHPMNNSVVDFTGLGTVERELQFLIDEGTIEIETDEEVIRFGKNMTSWDTEDLISQVEAFTGKKFTNKYPVEDLNIE